MSCDIDQRLNQLIQERMRTEKILEEMYNNLKQENVGMEEDLVDKDGFPRADIDIYKVRQARQAIIRSRNDFKKLSSEIEDLLQKKLPNHPEGQMDWSPQTAPSLEKNYKRMGRIKEVKQGSPVERSGLQEGDVIVEFGDVKESNFRTLQDISAEVKKKEGWYIKVLVLRNDTIKRVNLKPQKWSGLGLLGCFLEPLS